MGARAGIAGRRRRTVTVESLVAAATTFHDLPLSERDRTWDAAAADQRVQKWASSDGSGDKDKIDWDRYGQSQFWRDGASDGTALGDYKLGFADIIDGTLTAVWRGVTAAAGVVQGARGGVDIPDGDVAAVKAHIGRYYDKAEAKYGDDTIATPWESLSADADGDEPMQGECADCGHDAEMHAGSDNAGACSADECDCQGMKMAAAAGMTAFVRIRPEDADEFHVELRDLVRGAFRDVFAEMDLPEGLRPADVRPAANPSAEVEAPADVRTNASQLAWSAILAPEGKVTDDGRVFAPGSINWRELPLSLMAMTKTPGEGGHAGAQLAGRIDRIWRDDSAVPALIRAEGVFDDSDFGHEIARLVGDETLRGNSVDLAIREAEFGPRDLYVDERGVWRDDAPDAAADEEQDLVDLLFGSEAEDVIMIVRDASIGMSTVCPFPAFEDAGITLVAAAGDQPQFAIVPDPTGFRWRIWLKDAFESAGEVLTASAAGMVPVEPPAAWFADPELEDLTPLTITDDGRIVGHAWAWDTCHLGIPGACTTAPHSITDYEWFHLKEVVCEDGERIAVGTITLGTGHAEKTLGKGAATAHYDHTGTAVADVRVYEDEFGGAIAGALRPDTPAVRVRELRGATLSGDWRQVDGNLELVGLLAVNVPGFPVPRTRALVAAGVDGNEVLSLVAAGVTIEHRLDPRDRARLAALAAGAAGGIASVLELAGDPVDVPEIVELSRAEKIQAALTAAGVEQPEVATSYELTNGSLAERTFLAEVISAGLRETKRVEWPCDETLGDHGEVLARDGAWAAFRLEDGSIVYGGISGGWAYFRIATADRADAEAIAATFAQAYPPMYRSNDDDDRQVVPITFWTLGRFGPSSRMRMIDSAGWDDIAGNYTATVSDELERLMNGFEPGKTGQLLLWDGPPGTGKTWALRALASQWSGWAEFSYITDPDQFFVSDPSYMIDVLLSDTYATLDVGGEVVHELAEDGKWRVLILEDTGELLSASAKDTYAQGLSRLLNVVDGMVGQGLRVLALVTTNQEIEDLHPAVTRPGRCASQISFGALTKDEANAWLSTREGDDLNAHAVTGPATLAELYALAGGDEAAIADEPVPLDDEPAEAA